MKEELRAAVQQSLDKSQALPSLSLDQKRELEEYILQIPSGIRSAVENRQTTAQLKIYIDALFPFRARNKPRLQDLSPVSQWLYEHCVEQELNPCIVPVPGGQGILGLVQDDWALQISWNASEFVTTSTAPAADYTSAVRAAIAEMAKWVQHFEVDENLTWPEFQEELLNRAAGADQLA